MALEFHRKLPAYGASGGAASGLAVAAGAGLPA
jgi:hypothetical protein